MALQSSGQISLLNVATEFGGSAPHSLSEYYGAASGVPSSGTISLGDFYGASSSFAFTLSSSQENWNLRSAALASGWDGVSQLTVNISSGVYVWSDSISLAGLIISGSFAGGLIVNNSGFIMGRGGNGGSTSFAVQNGGPGITVSLTSGSASFNNQSSGYIGGGGGGGAVARFGTGGGGAGGGAGGTHTNRVTGGSGGSIGQAGGTGTAYSLPHSASVGTGGGAGGGGGMDDDLGGDNGWSAGGGGGRIFPGIGGGGGSSGGSSNNAGSNGSRSGDIYRAGGGGGWGASGGSYLGSGAGSGGAAISGSGYTVTGTTSQIYGSY